MDIGKVIGQIKEVGEAVIAVGIVVQINPNESTQSGEQKRDYAIQQIKEAVAAGGLTLPGWAIGVLPLLFNILIPILKRNQKYKDFIAALNVG